MRGSRRRAKSSRLRTMSVMRSIWSVMMRRLRCVRLVGRRRRSISARPRMTWSGAAISWPRPAARLPTTASFSVSRSRRASSTRSSASRSSRCAPARAGRHPVELAGQPGQLGAGPLLAGAVAELAAAQRLDGVDEAVERPGDEPPHEQHDDERHGREQRQRVEEEALRVRCRSACTNCHGCTTSMTPTTSPSGPSSGRTME
jgi:hypothetical protein